MSLFRARIARWAIATLVAAGCGASPHLADTAPEEPVHVGLNHIVIGMPLYREGDDGSQLRPFVDYLSRTFGVRVEIQMAEPYQTLPMLLRTGAVDVAQIPPLAYVRLHDQDPRVQAIATTVISGNPTYLGH